MSKGRAARVKGHGWERTVAIHLRTVDPSARRNVEETQISGLDIKTKLPLAIQCKAFSKWHTTVDEVLLQAAKAAEPGQTPVAIVKIDRREPTVTMYFTDFMAWITELFGACEEEVKDAI
jgi:hypothetical protein